MSYVIPPPLLDPKLPLTEAIIPVGWEHVGGPLQWCEFVGDVERSEQYGRIIRVKPYRALGNLLWTLSETGRFNARAILLYGPAGIGKTVLQVLLARTKLASRLEPVRVYMPGSEEHPYVTYVDYRTGEPLKINPPVDDRMGSLKFVRTQLSDSGDLSNQRLWHRNAGKCDKATFDELLNRIHRPRLGPDDKQVFVMSEFDQMLKSQLPAFKTALNPGTVPEQVLFLADTNDRHALYSKLEEAGWQRFDMRIGVSPWPGETLVLYAQHYGSLCGLQFDPTSFNGKGDPYRMIAESAEGSLRTVLQRLQLMRSSANPIPYSVLADMLEETASEQAQISGSVQRFFVMVLSRRKATPLDVSRFVLDLYKREIFLVGFCNDLAHQLLQQYPELVHVPKVADALNSIRQAVTTFPGESLTRLQWAAITPSLLAIAEALSEMAAPQAPQAPTRQFRVPSR